MQYMDWIDNADSYVCPVCRYETDNPGRYPMATCPKCGWRPVPERVRNMVSPLAYWCEDDVGPYCPVCHGHNTRMSRFCPDCGVRLK